MLPYALLPIATQAFEITIVSIVPTPTLGVFHPLLSRPKNIVLSDICIAYILVLLICLEILPKATTVDVPHHWCPFVSASCKLTSLSICSTAWHAIAQCQGRTLGKKWCAWNDASWVLIVAREERLSDRSSVAKKLAGTESLLNMYIHPATSLSFWTMGWTSLLLSPTFWSTSLEHPELVFVFIDFLATLLIFESMSSSFLKGSVCFPLFQTVLFNSLPFNVTTAREKGQRLTTFTK